jgi:hypothetical protein
MNMIKIISLSSLVIILLSCNNRNNGDKADSENIVKNNYFQTFSQESIDKVEMIYSLEYYKNEIIEYQDNYYGFDDVSMKITDLMNISSIVEINNVIPNLLTFLVSWFNAKGYVYYLYGFNGDQRITGHYYCGQFVPFENHRILMEKLGGEKLEYGDISVGDFNKDGVDEILLYSQYQHIGYVFCVYGFNIEENKLDELCLAPVFINFENPFPSVESIENGFKILEVIDKDYMDLAWNNYVWDKNTGKYVK